MTFGKHRQPRLKELAAELELSITTVSRALAGYSDVSEATRDRVRQLAARMGYVPSRAGRALVSGSSGFVGLVLPARDTKTRSDALTKTTFTDAYLGEFVMVLIDALSDSGRDITISTATSSAAKNRQPIDALRRVVNGQQVDGVIVADRTHTHDDRVSFLIDRQVPFVVYGRVLDERRRHTWFDTDGVTAFADAATMLIALGHRRFGLLTFAEPLTFAHHRRQGLECTLHQHGLCLPDRAIASIDRFSETEIAQAAHRLLNQIPRPTAILCATDALALKLVEIAAGLSIDVPGELSVIGFDNVPVSAYAHPGITTFDQRISDSAIAIADMMVRQLDGGLAPIPSRAIKPDLVVRGSHGRAPAP